MTLRMIAMPVAAPANTEAEIWERVIHPDGGMTRETARHVLKLTFWEDEQTRMHELATKNQSGTLTPDEEAELDNYCRVGTLLSALKSRARKLLKSRRRIA